MPLPHDPADRHRAVAATFAEAARAVTDWDAPSPVPEWRARDVVGHLVEWLPGFLSSTDARLPEVSLDDPVAAWERRAADVSRCSTTPPRPSGRSATRTPASWGCATRSTGSTPRRADARLGPRARRRPPRPDPPRRRRGDAGRDDRDGGAAPLLGQFGPAVPAPEGASPGDRLMAFLGRDATLPPTPEPA